MARGNYPPSYPPDQWLPTTDATALRIREHLKQGSCPYCDRSGFHVVATHVILAHGISLEQLRNDAFLRATDSMCSPETRERRRKATQKQMDEGRLKYGKGRKGRPARLKAGKASVFPMEGRSRAQRVADRANGLALQMEKTGDTALAKSVRAWAIKYQTNK